MALLARLQDRVAAADANINGLCEGLDAARLHSVARAVREERAGLTIPAHQLYERKPQHGDFSPVYLTPKGTAGARRCTVGGKLLTAGHSSNTPPGSEPPRTPPAMYSSPFLLKQFADASGTAGGSARPRTAAATASAQAWCGPIDSLTNRQLYERHRALSKGWRAPPASARAPAPAGCDSAEVQILDVDAERATEERRGADAAAAEAASVAGAAEVASVAEAAQVSEPSAAVDVSEVAHDELTPPSASRIPRVVRGAVAPKPYRPLSSTRCEDAAAFYKHAAARQLALPSQQSTRPPTASRARARTFERSDIFCTSREEVSSHANHSRGHRDIGPSLPARGAVASRPSGPAFGAARR